MFLAEIFPVITTYAKQERMEKEAFELGKDAGYQQGFKEGMDLKVQKTKDVTEEEYKKFLEFMVNNGLEVRYSVNYGGKFSCGLQIRKRQYND